MLGVSSPLHVKLVWGMSSDDVLVLFFLNFNLVSQENQISFVQANLIWVSITCSLSP